MERAGRRNLPVYIGGNRARRFLLQPRFSEGLEEIGDCAFRNRPIHVASLSSSLRKLKKDSFDCLSQYHDFRGHLQELRIAPSGSIELDNGG